MSAYVVRTDIKFRSGYVPDITPEEFTSYEGATEQQEIIVKDVMEVIDMVQHAFVWIETAESWGIRPMRMWTSGMTCDDRR